MDLVVDGDRRPMTLDERGWWHADAPAGPGARYAFSVDGGGPLPDPRSVDQPDGIDTASAVYDHGAFEWHDQAWPGIDLSTSVLYELHVGTFSEAGTFDGVIDHLDHLVDLGIDAVELMPVATGSGRRGWGYDGVQLFAPHPAYGGPDGLKRLVDACHGAGLGVVVDVVYNHFGPAGNHLPELAPYLTDRHQTVWGDAVSFDGPDAHEVRRFVVDNACMWLRDFHCDGLRLDAVHAITDTSPVHVLAELGAAVHDLAEELGRRLFVVAESDLNDPVFVQPPPEGYGLDAAWADDWHHALHAVLTGERDGYYVDFGTLDALTKAIDQAWVHDGSWSEHRGRPHGHKPTGLPADRFVVAAQNHDQVGNRAAGERLIALTTPGRARIAAALLLTTPFVPMLFQGEEWAASTPFLYFTDHADPELGRAVSEGRRREFAAFGWPPDAVPDPQDPSTFQRSKLAWAERSEPGHQAMLHWYRSLLALRRARADLRDPVVLARARHHRDVVTVDRGRVRVVANLAGDERVVPRPAGAEVLLASPDGPSVEGTEVRLPPDSVVLLRLPSPTDG
ncbi:MAG: malto-oligosyltrehalose trehalohydrolase [Acidimicrobiales bacterium]